MKRATWMGFLFLVGCSSQGPAGPAGAAGSAVATRTTAEPPGARCPAGGSVIDFGSDTDGDGKLSEGEVDATLRQVVCNGGAGPAGPAGTPGAAGPGTLSTSTIETPGANCTFGGLKVEAGIDANANGALDASEIDPSLTRYVCNGATGATGAMGAQGPTGMTGPAGPTGPAADPTLFVQNQNGTAQPASFRVSGTGEVGGLTVTGARAVESDPAATSLRVTSPLRDNFVLKSDGAFVAPGFVRDVGSTTGCAQYLPATGAGTRFMWHPCRGSVRFGRVPTNRTDWDDANMDDFTFAGGNQVIASRYGAFAYGDQVNVSSTVGVGFGSAVTVSGTAGFSAGASNVCSGFACTAIGYTVRAGGQGSIALGYRTTANNDYTTALGYRASNNGFTGTFVWGDESTTDSVRNQANNEFRLRANGGIRLRVSTAASGNTPGAGGNVGCDLTVAVPSWTCASSRDLKENFEELDGEEVLSKLRQMPVTRWNWTVDPKNTPHVGPVAQDFYAAFKLGDSDTSVGLQDLSGVALAAAKALEKRTAELEARTREVETLRAQLSAMQRQLERLEQRMGPPAKK